MRTTATLLAIISVFAMWRPAASDESQIMTVAQLAAKCSTSDASAAAFCLGLTTGVLTQLQANGNIYMAGRLGDDARNALQLAGAACSAVEPKLALRAFIRWAELHPERRDWNGISGVAAAIRQAWPCKEHL